MLLVFISNDYLEILIKTDKVCRLECQTEEVGKREPEPGVCKH